MSDVASAAPSAGWYDDPADPARLRWWNGAAWTDRGMAKDASPASPGSVADTAAPDRLATVTPITAAMAPPPPGARPALALPVPADPQSDVPPTAVPTDVTGLTLPGPQGPSADSPIRQLALAPDPVEAAAPAAGIPATGEQELAALLAARMAQLGLGDAQPAPDTAVAAPRARVAADMQMFFPGQAPAVPRGNPLLGLAGPAALAALPVPTEAEPEAPAAMPSRGRRERAPRELKAPRERPARKPKPAREPKPVREPKAARAKKPARETKPARVPARVSSDTPSRGLRALWNRPASAAPAAEPIAGSSISAQAQPEPVLTATADSTPPARADLGAEAGPPERTLAQETIDASPGTAAEPEPEAVAPATVEGTAEDAVAAPETEPAAATDSSALESPAPRGRRAATPPTAAPVPPVPPSPLPMTAEPRASAAAGAPRPPATVAAPTGPALAGRAPTALSHPAPALSVTPSTAAAPPAPEPPRAARPAPGPSGPPLRAPGAAPAPTGPALAGAAPRPPIPAPLGALTPGSVIQPRTPLPPAAAPASTGDALPHSIASRGAWWSELLPRTSNTVGAWLLALVPLGAVAAAAAVAWVAVAHPRWILLALGIAAVGVVLVPIFLVANDHSRLRALGWERQPRALSILLGSVTYLLARQMALGRQGATVLPLTVATIVAAIVALAGAVAGALYGQEVLQAWIASARAALMI